MAVLVKPFLIRGMGACCYLLFSVGREMIWLHNKRRAAALALPVVGPQLWSLKLLPIALIARLVTHQTLKD